ncbi:MAG: hypothetical protein ISR65_06080 [Bacteriovoracaceae bacterium]|nr:hypothetical protein [Bacteriovoracaceae bacterium]
METFIGRLVLLAILIFHFNNGFAINNNEKTISRAPATASAVSISNQASAMIAPSGQVSVILNNNKAFEQKLELINNASQSIYLSYYIFENDQSTAVIANALIQKARSGKQVKILVDYQKNYSNLDYFRMLEQKGGSNLQVRFYNRPTKNIIRDAIYLTMPCPDGTSFGTKACVKGKIALTNKIVDREAKGRSGYGNASQISNASSVKAKDEAVPYSQLFLSGLHSLKPQIMAMAIIKGQKLDIADILKSTGGKKLSKKDKEDLKEILKIYYLSKTASPVKKYYNKFKLTIASMLYKDTVPGLINAIATLIPSELHGDGNRGNDWNYITDSIHHKLLIVDNKYIQLGGRNMSNSYHMDPSAMSDKYSFMDVDVQVNAARGGDGVADSFLELFNYRRLTATIADIDKHASNDFMANFTKYAKTQAICLASSALKNKDDILSKSNLPKSIVDYQECVDSKYPKDFDSRSTRIEDQWDKLLVLASQYYNDYQEFYYTGAFKQMLRTNFVIDPRLEETQGNDAYFGRTWGEQKGFMMAYLENLPYDRWEEEEDARGEESWPVEPSERTRTYGSVDSRSYDAGKAIHTVIASALDNVCTQAEKENKQKHIIFHNAYMLPPAIFLRELRKMADGTYDCSNVTVRFLTNSTATTDIKVVNFFAKYIMEAFFKYVKQAKMEASPQQRSKHAKFEYYEYIGQSQKSKDLSLHTKLFIIGDDAFIGSANMDPRSYMMNTENGFYFRNVPNFVNEYVDYLDKIVNNRSITKDITSTFENATDSDLQQQDERLIDSLLKKYHVYEFVKDKKELKILKKQVSRLLSKVRDLAQKTVELGSDKDEASLLRRFYRTVITGKDKGDEFNYLLRLI